MIEKEVLFTAGTRSGKVSAIFMRPEDARWLMVLAHGAGAGMRHAFITGMAQCLARHRVASFRYQFPYKEQGKKAPNPEPVLLETVRAAFRAAHDLESGLPLLGGGKSLGGRMTSTAASRGMLPDIKGIAFFGFPLHAPGKPSDARGVHLFDVRVPMLFFQGTRDNLADLAYLQPLVEKLQAQGNTRLHIVEGADHGFRVPAGSGRTGDDVFEEMGRAVRQWAEGIDNR